MEIAEVSRRNLRPLGRILALVTSIAFLVLFVLSGWALSGLIMADCMDVADCKDLAAAQELTLATTALFGLLALGSGSVGVALLIGRRSDPSQQVTGLR